MFCRDCGRSIHQALDKAIGEPAESAWAMVWMSDETNEWTCEVTGNEHRPGDSPYTEEDRTRFMEGQCHALALAVGDLLEQSGEPVEYIAAWLDPRGEEALEDLDPSQDYERGPAPSPGIVQHVMVLYDNEIVDAAGRTPVKQMDAYCFDGILGWTSTDMPLVRYTVVDRAWIEGLAEAWRPMDLEAARRVAPIVVARVNQDYT